MRTPTMLLVFASTFGLALGNAIDDFTKLQNMISTTASQISNSVRTVNATNAQNETYQIAVSDPYPTADKLQNVIFTLGTSQIGYETGMTSFIARTKATDMNTAYLAYINEVPGLAQALIARGRAWHVDQNIDVFNAVTNLAKVIQNYGNGLTERHLIGTDSIIRTITAGNTLVDAEEAWMGSGSLPTKKARALKA